MLLTLQETSAPSIKISHYENMKLTFKSSVRCLWAVFDLSSLNFEQNNAW